MLSAAMLKALLHPCTLKFPCRIHPIGGGALKAEDMHVVSDLRQTMQAGGPVHAIE